MTPPAPSATSDASTTADAVHLDGVRPADPPTLLLPGFWQGGCPVDFRWVRETGVDVVVDLADAGTYAPDGATDGLAYVKCALVDGDDVDVPLVTGLASLVAGLLREGRAVLLHCTFGRNRSGLVATLVVREALGLTGAEALAHVQSRRRETVNNAAFADWLRALPAPGATAGAGRPV
ncbi:protein-tyrosine phosphatase family protein [Cellulomonas fimi]|uniref:protein-tyrosine phosphatase family protein n=1 Tax=Cellulomonas fimi TaxID=1708 RepID=UPI0002ED2B5F|nr:dual specificity protein phosphatase family protein [Cellulomonas fimi]NNH07223.1 hypothetical protein [Cellulomonas fimi]VEH27784.1 Dual specificity phosphatase, catalytic domain [Cellulomonas fimi]